MWEITFRIKEFCSSQSTSDFLLCEMSTVLRGLFFLMINCLFGCFDRILVLSVEDRCHLMSARGTGNFDIFFISSGNRHKFTSMFNCASLVHPCTSVACCQTKFQVPLTALIRHLYFEEPYSDSDKHWKDCFYNQKKTPHFRTVVFRSGRKSTANQRNIIVATLLNPSFTIAWNIYGRNRIKKYIFYKDYTNIRQSKS